MRPDLSLLFDRPFWLDEWHAVLPASRPSLGAVLSDLHAGSDFAPPFLHVSLWLLRVITGGGELTPTLARSFTAACVVGAIVLVYLTLRRSFAVAPSVAGALVCATHGLVIAYAFEARFYAPWLLWAAAFAWALACHPEERSDEGSAVAPRSRRRDIAIALSSIGLCTSHWFGVITLGLMCLGAVIALRREWRAAVRLLLPAVAGLVSLAVSLPLFFGQRGAIREKSWIAELSWAQFRDLILMYWSSTPLLLALAAVAAALLLPRFKEPLRAAALPALRDPSIAALIAVAAMPFVQTIISIKQPAMLPRYGLTAVLAWAPLVSLAVQMLPRAARVACVFLLSLGVLLQIGSQLGVQRGVNEMVANDGRLLRDACASKAGVAFVTRVQMYYYTDELRQSCSQGAYLILPPETLARLFAGPNAFAQRQHRTEAEFALLHQRLYGFPRTVTPAQLDSLPHFVVMVEPWSIPRDAAGREFFSRVVFPRHQASPMAGNGIAYVRTEVPASPAPTRP